jgi:hypothetical protein
VTVLGVKYTTARGVMQRALRLVFHDLGRSPGVPLLGEPLPFACSLPGTLAERTRTAVQDEMARTLEDAVLRRLDLGTAGPPAETETDEVARAMAAELHWDEAETARQRRSLARFYEAAYNGDKAVL